MLEVMEQLCDDVVSHDEGRALELAVNVCDHVIECVDADASSAVQLSKRSLLVAAINAATTDRIERK
jgi:hypothetical protein